MTGILTGSTARGLAYFGISTLRGYRFPRYFRQIIREDPRSHAETARTSLVRMLMHCRENVPFYSDRLAPFCAESIRKDPLQVLSSLPVLTKAIVRANFEGLTSRDIARRKWHYNTSGGSTGEPVKLIQDREYADWAHAIPLYFYHRVGCRVGDPVVRLWGSERDIFEGTVGLRAKVFNFFNNVEYMNAFRMTPRTMREFLSRLDSRPPRMIIAYTQAMYELAQFARAHGIRVSPQGPVIASAGTLHPFMRELIAEVFGCRVFNSYGTREVGTIASEVPGRDGLMVAPWGCYVEVVDGSGEALPAGSEGDLLITSLANRAMPLVRYKIGDRGALSPPASPTQDAFSQTLLSVSGRITDNFRTRDGKIIPGEYFIHMLGVVLNSDGAIRKFQVIQKDYDRIVLKIVKDRDFDPSDVIDAVRRIMESPCRVDIEYPESIPPLPSGKYRYTISEIP